MAPREPLPVQPMRLQAQPPSLAPTLATAAAMLAAAVSPRTAAANTAPSTPQTTVAQREALAPGQAPAVLGAPIKDLPIVPKLRLEQVKPSTHPTLADATLSSMAAAATSVMSARSVSIVGESARDRSAPECIDGSKLDSALDELLNSARGFQVVGPSLARSQTELSGTSVTEVPEKFVQPVRHPDGPCRLFLLACGIRGCTPRHC